jgi:LEA14-like dessication related protein
MQPLKWVAIALALLLTGCVTAKLQAPHLTIIGASMLSADVFAQEFRVRLHVENPNARDLPIKSIEYQLYLEGDIFADGASEASFVVPANGTKDFDLAVHTHFMSSIGRLLSRLTGTDRQDVEYAFTGAVVVAAPFSPKIKFAERGMVNLARR